VGGDLDREEGAGVGGDLEVDLEGGHEAVDGDVDGGGGRVGGERSRQRRAKGRPDVEWGRLTGVESKE